MASDNRYDTSETRDLRGQLARGESFDVAETRIQGCRDLNERQYLAEALADWWDKPGFLAAWVQASPGSHIPVLLSGIHGVKWAWRARGVRHQAVNEQECRTRAQVAQFQLADASTRAPHDPIAWAWLIACHSTLGEKAQAEAAFVEAVKNAPGFRLAHTLILQHRMTYWTGNESAVIEFAHERVRKAPAGSGVETLWCELAYFLPYKGDTGSWNRTEFQAQIRAAEERYFKAGTFRETPESLRNRNWFAYVFWRMGDFARAAEQFKKLGNVKQVRPWGESHPIIDWLVDDYRKARKACLAGR